MLEEPEQNDSASTLDGNIPSRCNCKLGMNPISRRVVPVQLAGSLARRGSDGTAKGEGDGVTALREGLCRRKVGERKKKGRLDVG